MTRRRQAEHAARIANRGLIELRARTLRLALETEKQLLGFHLEGSGPAGDQLHAQLLDLLCRRLVGDRGSEPATVQPFELAALAERTLGC